MKQKYISVNIYSNIFGHTSILMSQLVKFISNYIIVTIGHKNSQQVPKFENYKHTYSKV